MSARYQVVRTSTECITVEGTSPADALGAATDYSHQYGWSDAEVAYTVREVP